MADENDTGDGATREDGGGDVETRGEPLDPDEAFALVGHETRFAILRALWDATDHRATFSDLRESVGMRDSGRFNYHLGKLVGSFVARTDGAYELTTAGSALMGAVLSGAYTRQGTLGPVPVEEPCPVCAGEAAVRLDDGTATVDCGDCGTVLAAFPLPPATVDDYEPEELPEVVDRYVRVLLRQLDAGFCPVCSGRLDRRLVLHEADDPVLQGRNWETPFAVGRYECRRCDSEFHGMLGFLLERDRVRRFHLEHGVDPNERPFWTLEWFYLPAELTVLDPDAPRVRVGIRAGDGLLSVTVGPDLSIEEAVVGGAETTDRA